MNFDNIHPTIFAIIDDGKGNLLLGTSNGLYHYTGSSNKLILSGDRLDELRINDVQHYKDKKFLIGTDRAIYKYDLESDQLSIICLLYTSPSPRDQRGSRMPSSA